MSNTGHFFPRIHPSRAAVEQRPLSESKRERGSWAVFFFSSETQNLKSAISRRGDGKKKTYVANPEKKSRNQEHDLSAHVDFSSL